jgi:hypothetical protein
MEFEANGQGARAMNRPRKDVFPYTSQLRYNALLFLVGINVGISVASNLYRSLPMHRAMVLTTIAVGILGAMQIVLLLIEGLRLRRVKRELEQERDELLTNMKTELDKIFPGDPVRVAGLVLHFRETLTP